MKKIIILCIVMALSVVGCESGKVTEVESLKSFFELTLDKNLLDISLEDTKETLKEYSYEYEFMEYSKEEKEEMKDITGEEPSDFSFSEFVDDNNSSIEISFNETNKEVIGVAYTENTDDTSKYISRIGESCSVHVSTNNIKSQSAMIENLDLSESTMDIVNKYIKLVDNMNENTKLKIEEAIDILNMDYKIEDNDTYIFEVDGEDSYIEVSIIDNDIISADIKLGMSEKVNYNISIKTWNKDTFLSENHFNTEITIMNNGTIYDYENTSEQERKENNIKSNKKIFDFVYNDKKLEYYNSNYNENEIELIHGRYNSEEEAYVVTPNQDRIIDDALYSTGTREFTVKLEKGEHIRLEIKTEDNNEIGSQMPINIYDLSIYDTIYSEIIDIKNDNIINTDKVEKEGNYEVVLDIKNMDSYSIKAYAIKD